MEISFDPAKDTSNQKKHGVSLALAKAIDWAEVERSTDACKDYGEHTAIAYAVIERRLYCVAFTDRDETVRVISIRKANKREVERYVEQA